MIARRGPIAPSDPATHEYTEAQITELIRQLQERGNRLGLLWGSARTNGTVNGHVLVNFGNAPVSTLLNLLALITNAEAKGSPWE
ncbi:ADP-heptose:LPS heptosyltransferase [Kitasatospora sp. GP30]|uniref:hypothetical protein n=1 Tax=Kitasatospora sp. GP30 TaxID=3035084 RepID=UPI000C703DDB|nr:hypothetical protein [Kitasatospora sp. GP30]MDH6141594.1 ADP-heptose:LPS heptosyltransferase [Kitasatospora sp. GP30]